MPAVLGGDWDAGWLVLEFVEGKTVRRVLDEWVERVVAREKLGTLDEEQEQKEVEREGKGDGSEDKEHKAILDLMARIGCAVGKLHDIGIVHGDLTTSNLMLSPTSPSSTTPPSPPQSDLDGDIVLIDFGLAAQSLRQTQEEDRAVDLYVLERAFAATHPRAEHLFEEVLRAYGASYKGAHITLKRLEGVRLRGRKRSMLG